MTPSDFSSPETGKTQPAAATELMTIDRSCGPVPMIITSDLSLSSIKSFSRHHRFTAAAEQAAN
jgi:hypothetical protein